MFTRHVRGTMIVLACLPLFVDPQQASACGCRKWFGAQPVAVAATAPPFVASYAPTGCGQTVNYVPQTAFRTVFMNVPVTSFTPVTACNACGGATTVMRPVTTFVTQARLVPYTTFRPVVTANFAPVATVAPACGGCATAAAVAPATTTTFFAPAAPVAVAAPAQPCCSGTAGFAQSPVTSFAPVAAPMAPGAPVAVAQPQGAPGTVIRSLTPSPAVTATPGLTPIPAPPSAPPSFTPSEATQPSLNGSSNGAPNKTFDESAPQPAPPAAQPESRIVLPPRSEPTSSPIRGLDPEENEDRVTSSPVRPAYAVKTASLTTPVAPKAKQLDDSGWRAAKK